MDFSENFVPPLSRDYLLRRVAEPKVAPKPRKKKAEDPLITAPMLFPETKDQDDFNSFTQGFMEMYHPRTADEKRLVYEYAKTRWTLWWVEYTEDEYAHAWKQELRSTRAIRGDDPDYYLDIEVLRLRSVDRQFLSLSKQYYKTRSRRTRLEKLIRAAGMPHALPKAPEATGTIRPAAARSLMDIPDSELPRA